MSPQVAMKKTLRNRSGARLIKDEGQRLKDKVRNCFHFILYPLSFILSLLAVDGGGNDQGHADDHRANYDRKRRVLVVLDLLFDRKRGYKDNDQKGDGKNDQADCYKNDGRFDYRQKLFQFNQSQNRGDR